MRTLIGLAGAALLCATGAAAQTPAAGEPTTARFERTDTADQMQRGRSANPNDRVCRTITATGSRLGARRQCRTRAEWDGLSRDHRENTNDVVRQNLTGTTIAGTSGG